MSGYYPDGCTQSMLDRWLEDECREDAELDFAQCEHGTGAGCPICLEEM